MSTDQPALDLPFGVQIRGPIRPDYAEILTKDALKFLADLHRSFDGRRRTPLRTRMHNQQAFNDGRLHHTSGKVLVVGGGDTSMDVAAVARRLGHITHKREHERPENIVMGYMAHDVADVANRQGANVTLISRESADIMPATKMEVEHVTQEGVTIRPGLLPVEVILNEDGRATGVRVTSVAIRFGAAVGLDAGVRAESGA